MPISSFQYAEMLQRTQTRRAVMVEAVTKGVEHEKNLHDEIIKFCRERPQPWVCFHSRMDKRQHSNLGMPDFVIVSHTGTVWFIECKRKGSKPTVAQNAMLAWLRKNGANAGVVYSLEEFKSLVA